MYRETHGCASKVRSRQYQHCNAAHYHMNHVWVVWPMSFCPRVQAIGQHAFPLKCGTFYLDDKTKANYWWKNVDELLSHELSFILASNDLVRLKHFDISIGGVHGKGWFRMVLKLLLFYRENEKPSWNLVFKVGWVDCDKHKQSSILPLGESIKWITASRQFVALA